MNIKRSLKIAGATVASVGLAVGFSGAGVASASSFNWHYNHHHTMPTAIIDSGNTTTENDTKIKLYNNTVQNAETGSATVEAGQDHHYSLFHHHGNGQNSGTAAAATGAASNAAAANASVTVHNQAIAAAAMPSVPANTNVIKSGNTSVDNYTYVRITNNTVQNATSGDATVEGNVSAGSATTGDASNTADASFTVSVSN